DLGRVDGYAKFCNKLWNAARYVLMNTEGEDCGLDGERELSLADQWIRSRLAATIDEVHLRYRDYRFDLAAQALYEFAWYEFCDWYLELSKPALQSGETSPAARRGTRHTLVTVLEGYLRLLHPLMPFITEEIWQRVAPLAGRSGSTIMCAPYPEPDDFPRDAQAESRIAAIRALVLGARQIRGQLDVPQSRAVPIYVIASQLVDVEVAMSAEALIRAVGNISTIEFVSSESDAPPSALAIIEGRSIFVPLRDLIDDPAAELRRLEKRAERVRQDLGRSTGKLANASFVANAPAEVVERERSRVAELERELSALEEQRRRVAALG
ncbi:MAG TPA: class I tRNA ligase family protein, partial [Steroidobacteraceae bacterium]|nr:class I tRNA ligase family protein [Steroidobacteraceae bacterium]